jgi:integrase
VIAMRVKLNTEFVRKLPLKDVDVWDTKYPGLVLRCRASGAHSYRVSYGRGKWVTLGRADVLTPDEARGKARDELSRIDKGHDPKAARLVKGNLTLRRYLDEHYGPWLTGQRPRTEQILRLTSSAFADLHEVKLSAITGFQIERWRSARLKDDVAASTCNRDLGALKSALSRAVKWSLLKQNPLGDVKRLQEDERGVVRYLTAAEETRLRKALEARDARRNAKREAANQWRRARGYAEMSADNRGHLTPIVLLALNTGCRRGEIFNLEWSDVDLVGKQMTIRGAGAKSGQTRHIPLNTEAADVLTSWQAVTGTTTGFVFPGRDVDGKIQRMDDIKKGWLSVVKAAKLSDFRFHDTRHSFASRLVMAGIDLNTVRELLGHADLKMTLRYAHLAPAHKAAAVEKLVGRGA